MFVFQSEANIAQQNGYNRQITNVQWNLAVLEYFDIKEYGRFFNEFNAA